MNILANCIRALQRHTNGLRTGRRTKYASSITILLVIICVIFVYHDESYKYTSSSLSKLNDQINYLSAKVDSWRLVESANSVEVPLNGGNHTLLVQKENHKQKAVIMMFAKNNQLFKLLETIRTVEERFNRGYQYDWLLVTDLAFSGKFRQAVQAMTRSEVKFHTVPKSMNSLPGNIDRNKMKESKRRLRKQGINVHNSQKLRNLQRLWTQEIFTIDILNEYDYYMKIEPGVQLLCDLPLDVFDFMKQNKKTYGFSFAARADPNGMPTFWENTLKFIEQNPKVVHPNHFLDFMSDDKGATFNGCQFRANFEVGALEFFRSEKYQKFAAHFLDYNGIYYETWEDSTIRTLGVSLLLDKNSLQFFNNLGYNDFDLKVNHKSCPFDLNVRLKNMCVCNPLDEINWNGDSCIERFFELNNIAIPEDVEDRRNYEAQEKEKASKLKEKEAAEREEQRKAKEAEQSEQDKLREGFGEGKDDDRDIRE